MLRNQKHTAMRSQLVPGKTLQETLYFVKSEEYIVAVQALDLLRAHLPPTLTNIGQYDDETVRARCEELRLDMLSGLSRLARGYGETAFSPNDSLLIGKAFDYLGEQTADTLDPADQERYLRFVPAANLILRDISTEYLTFDVPSAVALS